MNSFSGFICVCVCVRVCVACVCVRTHPCAHVQFHFQHSKQVTWCIYSQGTATSESRKELAIDATPVPLAWQLLRWKRGRSQVEGKLKVERSIWEWVYVASTCFCCCQLESTLHSTGSLNDLFCFPRHLYLLNSLWNTYSSLNQRLRIFPTPTQLQRDDTKMKLFPFLLLFFLLFFFFFSSSSIFILEPRSENIQPCNLPCRKVWEKVFPKWLISQAPVYSGNS